MSGLLSNRLGVPLCLTRAFHLKELHALNRGHGKWALQSERWNLTTAPGEHVSISSTFVVETAKN